MNSKLETAIKIAFVIGLSALAIGGTIWFISNLYRTITTKEIVIAPFHVIDPTGKQKNLEHGLTNLFIAQLQLIDRDIRIAREALKNPLTEDIANLTYKKISARNRDPEEEIRATIKTTSELEVKIAEVDVGGILRRVKQFFSQSKTLQFTVHYGADDAIIAGNIDALGGKKNRSIWIPSKANPKDIAENLAYHLHQIKLSDGEHPALQSLDLVEFREMANVLGDVARINSFSNLIQPSQKDYFSLYETLEPISKKLTGWDSLNFVLASLARKSGQPQIALEIYQNFESLYSESGKSTEELSFAIEASNVEILAVNLLLTSVIRLNSSTNLRADVVSNKRKKISDLTDIEISNLRDAFKQSYSNTNSNERGYTFIAGIHGLPQPYYSQNQSELFLFWNRAYLQYFEESLRSNNNYISIPYWDWGAKIEIPAIFQAAQINGGHNPLYSAKISTQLSESIPAGQLSNYVRDNATFRSPVKDGIEIVNERISQLLEIEDFSEFSSQLEYINGSAHIRVGGTLSSVPFSSYDPLFWSLRANTDRLFVEWQSRHGNSTIPKSILDSELPPFQIYVKDLLEVDSLNYGY